MGKRHRLAQPRASSARRYDVVAFGASWGGVDALSRIVRAWPEDAGVAVVIVQHQHAYSGNALQRILSRQTTLQVVDVEDKQEMRPGQFHIAPANYHLLLEADGSFALSVEAPVNFSRPSIDVTFESLALTIGKRCIGVLLTGANDDGVAGLRQIRRHGGYVVVQDPATAEVATMPKAAIDAGVVDEVVALDEMVTHLMKLLRDGNA